MKTATQMLQRSEAATQVHFAALRYMDRLNRDGHAISNHVSAEVYRRACAAEIHQRMLAELEPWQQAAARLTLHMLRPQPEIPPQLRELIDSIVQRWQAVAAELLGEPPT